MTGLCLWLKKQWTFTLNVWFSYGFADQIFNDNWYSVIFGQSSYESPQVFDKSYIQSLSYYKCIILVYVYIVNHKRISLRRTSSKENKMLNSARLLCNVHSGLAQSPRHIPPKRLWKSVLVLHNVSGSHPEFKEQSYKVTEMDD